MYGVMPLTPSRVIAPVRAGAASAAFGNAMSDRERAPALPKTRVDPRPTAATAPLARAAAMNARRSKPAGAEFSTRLLAFGRAVGVRRNSGSARVAEAAPRRPATPARAVLPVPTATRSADSSATCGAAESASFQRRVKTNRKPTLTARATTAGAIFATLPTRVVRSAYAAARPTRPSAAVSARASRRLRQATMPVRAASTAMALKMPARRNGLSLVPRWLTAQSLTAPGVASMTRDPTAVLGVGAPPTMTETIIDAPTPAAADRSPAAAPSGMRMRLVGFTLLIRHRPHFGLPVEGQ